MNKCTGEKAVNDFQARKTMPSKYFRDKLEEVSAESFQSGNFPGITPTTMKGIRASSRKKGRLDNNLCASISMLQQSIAKEDEENAAKLGHM